MLLAIIFDILMNMWDSKSPPLRHLNCNGRICYALSYPGKPEGFFTDNDMIQPNLKFWKISNQFGDEEGTGRKGLSCLVTGIFIHIFVACFYTMYLCLSLLKLVTYIRPNILSKRFNVLYSEDLFSD